MDNFELKFDTKILHRISVATWMLGAVVIIIGVSVILGWQFDIPFLKSSIPATATAMNPTTAVAFILGGLWIFCYSLKKSPILCSGFSYAVLGISLVKAISFLGIDFGIDRILYPQQILQYVPVNAMAPNTTVCFVLIGVSMLILSGNFKRRILIAQLLSAVVFMVALFAFLGYAYGVVSLYRVSSFIPMAPFTSVAFLCLSFGLLLSTPTEGMVAIISRSGGGGYLWRRFSLIIFVTVSTVGWLSIFGYKYGFYDFELGITVVALFLILLFEILTWDTARTIDRAEVERIKLLQSLEDKNLELEHLERIEKEHLMSLEGNKSAMLNLLEDIARGKAQAEQSLAKNEAILASVGDGLIAVDEKGVIVLVNKIGAELLGTSIDKLIGENILSAWSVEDGDGKPIPDNERPLVKALYGTTTTTTTTTTNFYVKKNGEKLPVSVTVSPILLNGKIIGAVDIFRDVTDEKEIEKLRTDFLLLVSHQLRTPLSGMKWLIETLQGKLLGTVTPKQKVYLDDLHSINERMIQLVLDMLNVLRLESGHTALHKEEVSVADLYKDFSVYVDAAAKAKGVSVRNELIDRGDIKIKTDVQVLRSILDSFISNAINYSKSGQEVIVDVKDTDGAVTFYVKDNGIGIPKDEQDKVFARFYRASNAKEYKPDGTGLGLYIAATLADKIGAKTSFESEEGKGSIFFLDVPRGIDQDVVKTINI